MGYGGAFRRRTAMTNPLLAELTHHAYLRTQLQAQFPDVDDETLRDTLEGFTDLRRMLCHVIRSALEDRTLSAALRHRIEEMQARLRRLEHRVTVKREL